MTSSPSRLPASGRGDRERFAEWFAVRYGYQLSAGRRAAPKTDHRRHHSRHGK